METKITESIRRYIAISFTLFVAIGLITANFIGKSQNKVFAQDALKYSEMVNALQVGDIETALEKSASLKEHQKVSEIYNYSTGLALANAGEVEKAVRHFQRVLEINPHKTEDSLFMLQFAETLVLADMMENARIVLEKCSGLPTPDTFPQYQEMVAQLQEQLADQQS